jgi:hypothetical protein
MAKFTMQLKDGGEINAGYLKVQGAYKVFDTKRQGKQAHSNVEATSRKRFVTIYPPLLDTTTYLS